VFLPPDPKLTLSLSIPQDKVSYLKELLELMMVADSRRNPNANCNDPVMSGLVQNNPVLSLASTNPRSVKAKNNKI
jgi:hypothetical protein